MLPIENWQFGGDHLKGGIYIEILSLEREYEMPHIDRRKQKEEVHVPDAVVQNALDILDGRSRKCGAKIYQTNDHSSDLKKFRMK